MKIKNTLGTIFILAGVVLFLAHNAVMIGNPSESFSRDWLNLPVHAPPPWIGSIPWLGSLIEYAWQLFSLHGLVGIIILLSLCAIGIKLKGLKRP